MSYDAWKTTDPRDREPDLQLLLDREDEAIREQRWAEFQGTAKTFASYAQDWFYVLEDMARGYLERDKPDAFGPGRFAWHCQQFAESEGWPAVLNALARAMKESGQ